MENNQFVLDQSKSTDDREYLGYTIYGKHDFLDENKNPRINNENNSLAKSITVNNKTKYYIKVGSYGKVYNPMGLYSEGTSNKFLAKVGKNAWEFTEVNQKVFDMYVSFLRTKNQAWLNNAEREMN